MEETGSREGVEVFDLEKGGSLAGWLREKIRSASGEFRIEKDGKHVRFIEYIGRPTENDNNRE